MDKTHATGRMWALFKGVFMRAIDLSGRRFGQWSVVSPDPMRTSRGQMRFLCRCDCGTERVVASNNLKTGESTGCGHDKSERIRASKIKHGALANGEWHPLYNAWHAMHDRCSNIKNVEFKNYGARGISVCPEWTDFRRFAEDMGDKPTPQHSIDRYPNNDGNYEPGNCRWATKSEQNVNRRTTRLITFDGKTMCAADWAKHLGFTKSGIYARLRRMSIEEALSLPAIPKGQYIRKSSA